MRVMIIALATALAGCTPQVTWNKAGATQADFDQDSRECKYEARKAAAGAMSSMNTMGYGMYQRDQLYIECMGVRGYTQQAG